MRFIFIALNPEHAASVFQVAYPPAKDISWSTLVASFRQYLNTSGFQSLNLYLRNLRPTPNGLYFFPKLQPASNVPGAFVTRTNNGLGLDITTPDWWDNPDFTNWPQLWHEVKDRLQGDPVEITLNRKTYTYASAVFLVDLLKFAFAYNIHAKTMPPNVLADFYQDKGNPFLPVAQALRAI